MKRKLYLFGQTLKVLFRLKEIEMKRAEVKEKEAFNEV